MRSQRGANSEKHLAQCGLPLKGKNARSFKFSVIFFAPPSWVSDAIAVAQKCSLIMKEDGRCGLSIFQTIDTIYCVKFEKTIIYFAYWKLIEKNFLLSGWGCCAKFALIRGRTGTGHPEPSAGEQRARARIEYRTRSIFGYPDKWTTACRSGVRPSESGREKEKEADFSGSIRCAHVAALAPSRFMNIINLSYNHAAANHQTQWEARAF